MIIDLKQRQFEKKTKELQAAKAQLEELQLMSFETMTDSDSFFDENRITEYSEMVRDWSKTTKKDPSLSTLDKMRALVGAGRKIAQKDRK